MGGVRNGKAKAAARTKATAKAKVKATAQTQGQNGAKAVKLEKGSSTSSLAAVAAAPGIININRAPVLTLWISVCLRRLRHSEETSLSVAKVVTGRCASAKGKSLGIFSTPESGAPAKKPAAGVAEASPAAKQVRIAGHAVPVYDVGAGCLLAKSGATPVSARPVEAYLHRAFKGDLEVVRAAMERTAASYKPNELEANAMSLYERFRPAWKGWGVPGQLHLKDIRAAAR